MCEFDSILELRDRHLFHLKTHRTGNFNQDQYIYEY